MSVHPHVTDTQNSKIISGTNVYVMPEQHTGYINYWFIIVTIDLHNLSLGCNTHSTLTSFYPQHPTAISSADG
jgi:hypothetical protein